MVLEAAAPLHDTIKYPDVWWNDRAGYSTEQCNGAAASITALEDSRKITELQLTIISYIPRHLPSAGDSVIPIQ